MTFLLPLVALALALAAPFVSRPEREPFSPSRAAVLAVLLILGGLVVLKEAPAADRTPATLGLAIGAVASALGAWTGGFAVGVAGASALHLFPSNPSMGLALMAGGGLGALAVGGEAAALAAALVFAADDLGMRHSQVPAAAFAGSQIGVALAVGSFLAAFVPKTLTLARPVVVGLVAAAAGVLVSKGLGDPGLVLCGAVGALSGVVVHALMPNEESESSRVGLAAIVGIGLATFAYGLGRGAGMGLAALSAVGVLLAADNRRAVLALGPFVGLVLFRVLREAGTGATRALDIAQHYTLLALVLGMVLPLLPADWLALRGGRGTRVPAFPVGAFLWGLIVLAAAPLVVVALGMRGGIGFVVGLGTTGLVQALRAIPDPRSRIADRRPDDPRSEIPDRKSILPLALGVGLGGSTILALAWLGDDSSLARDAKLHLFAYAAVGFAVVAGMLAFVGRRKVEVAS